MPDPSFRRGFPTTLAILAAAILFICFIQLMAKREARRSLSTVKADEPEAAGTAASDDGLDEKVELEYEQHGKVAPAQADPIK